MSLPAVTWILLLCYLALMTYLGYVGMRRTRDSDDYATARNSYGGLVLGLSFMAASASGATFLGIPAIGYEAGFKGAWIPMLSNVGIYVGLVIVARRGKYFADRLRSRTVPDFMGDLYRSPILRLIASLVSLFVIFAAMAQVASAGQMFETTLGISYTWGITITVAIVLFYMFIGGSHSDIITDAVQGALMLVVALFVFGAFLFGAGVPGVGPHAVNSALDPSQRWDVLTDTSNPLFVSWWVIILLFVSHLGQFSTPFLGNKFFALRGRRQINNFVVMAGFTGIGVGVMFLGGVLGRAMGISDIHPDAIIPNLFIQLLPAWTASLFTVVVLSAIMSTTDGILMSISQVFSNDLYRRTYIPWRGMDPDSPQVDRNSLRIGRVGVLVSGIVAGAAVYSPPEFMFILAGLGLSAVTGTLAAPFGLALLFPNLVTRVGGIASAVAGLSTFVVLHGGPQFDIYDGAFPWNENPYASGAAAMAVGVVTCVTASLLSRRLGAIDSVGDAAPVDVSTKGRRG